MIVILAVDVDGTSFYNVFLYKARISEMEGKTERGR